MSLVRAAPTEEELRLVENQEKSNHLKGEPAGTSTEEDFKPAS